MGERLAGRSARPARPPHFLAYLHISSGLDALDLATVDTSDADAGGRRKARGDEHDEDHAEFDAHALREHEEFTKASLVGAWRGPWSGGVCRCGPRVGLRALLRASRPTSNPRQPPTHAQPTPTNP